MQQLASEGTNKRNLDFFQPEPLQTPPKLQRTISGMSEGTPKDKEEVEQQELDSILEVEVEQQAEAEQENIFDFNDYVKPGEVRKAHKGEACCLVSCLRFQEDRQGLLESEHERHVGQVQQDFLHQPVQEG